MEQSIILVTVMNRTIKKQFWLTKEEDASFKKKAEECCMNEATLFRKLIDGFEPKGKPPKEFYDDINMITEFITELRELQFSMDDEMLIGEISKCNKFQNLMYEIRICGGVLDEEKIIIISVFAVVSFLLCMRVFVQQ